MWKSRSWIHLKRYSQQALLEKVKASFKYKLIHQRPVSRTAMRNGCPHYKIFISDNTIIFEFL